MDLSALLGVAKVGGAVIGQIAHIAKDTKRVSGENNGTDNAKVTDVEALHQVVVKRPLNTLIAIAFNLCAVINLLPDTGNPISDVVTAFIHGYGSDSLINRPGQ